MVPTFPDKTSIWSCYGHPTLYDGLVQYKSFFVMRSVLLLVNSSKVDAWLAWRPQSGNWLPLRLCFWGRTKSWRRCRLPRAPDSRLFPMSLPSQATFPYLRGCWFSTRLLSQWNFLNGTPEWQGRIPWKNLHPSISHQTCLIFAVSLKQTKERYQKFVKGSLGRTYHEGGRSHFCGLGGAGLGCCFTSWRRAFDPWVFALLPCIEFPLRNAICTSFLTLLRYDAFTRYSLLTPRDAPIKLQTWKWNCETFMPINGTQCQGKAFWHGNNMQQRQEARSCYICNSIVSVR